MILRILIKLMFLIPFTITSPLAYSKLVAKLISAPSPAVHRQDSSHITVRKSTPKFSFSLTSNPSTGYTWFLQRYDNALVKPVRHYFKSSKSSLIGATGNEIWIFSMLPAAFVVPHQTKIHMVYRRPWEKTEINDEAIYTISTNVM